LNALDKKLWVYTILPAVILNVGGVLIYGVYYGLQYARPELVAGIAPGQVQFASAVLIFLVEWGLALLLIGRLRRSGQPLMQLIAPQGNLWRFRWLSALGLFLAWNGIFGLYLLLAGRLYRGVWESYEGLTLGWSIVQILLLPATAAFCEELIWRAYIPTQLERRGYRSWAIVGLSALSFALIHGVFLPDRIAATFLLGLIGGTYYLRQRSLVPLICTHWFVDFWSFGLFLFVF
jgi:membrane protease YdiL (CAAX protease family)